MCDSCIIQLNVAYNLKKNAIQSDLKLRQYMIEFGMNVTSYTACSINTVSMIRPPPAILMPTSTTSESVTITTAKSTTVGPVRVPVAVPVQPTVQQQQQQQTQVQQQQQHQQLQKQKQPQPPPPPAPSQVHRPFPVMPIIIKEEPVDYCEVMSDITVDTNAEAFEHRNGTHHANGIRSTISTSSSSNKSMTPLPIHSMVSINPVNSKSLLISTQTASDSEYISAYILTNADKTTKTNTSTKAVAKRKSPSKSISLAEPKSKQKQKQNQNPKSSTPSSSPSASPPRQQANKQRNSSNHNTSDQSSGVSQHSPVAKRSREIDRLFDDSSIQNKLLNESAGRQTRQKLKTVEPNTNGLQQSNQQQQEQQEQRSRSRNSTPKIDYKSFFSVRELKRRLSMENSSAAARRKITVKKAMADKIKSPTVNGKRGSSMPQSRARI